MATSRPSIVAVLCAVGALACSVPKPNRADAEPGDAAPCGGRCEGSERCVAGECVQRRIRDVAVGSGFTCVLFESGSVECFGGNDEGALGAGLPEDRPAELRHLPQPVVETLDSGDVALADATQIAAGATATCAVRAGGRVSCWGSDDARIFASRSHQFTSVDVRTPEGPAVADAVAGGRLAFLLHAGGTLLSAGVARFDGRADGAGEGFFEPVALPRPVRAMASLGPGGAATSLVALDDGSLRCFGSAIGGQCGDSGTNVVDAPLALDGAPSVIDVCLGVLHACALSDEGAVYCWGNAGTGARGLGPDAEDTPTPTRVDGLPSIREIECGAASTFAVSESGDELWAFGSNRDGRLGLGEFAAERVDEPQLALRVEGAQLRPSASTHTCVVRRMPGEPDAVLCAGTNRFGELGWPAETANVPEFTPVPGIP